MTDPHGGGPSLLCAILDLVSGECGEARVGGDGDGDAVVRSCVAGLGADTARRRTGGVCGRGGTHDVSVTCAAQHEWGTRDIYIGERSGY